MAAKYKIPRGTYDILPDQSYIRRFLQDKFREAAETFNYREIITPIFEVADLFERTVGDSSDIVQKEMYKFQDKKGRIFALRPEGTASVVRSYVENNLDLKENSSKLYYMGPMFRYDRPQKGRYRQFYQFGIENIGSDSPYVDAEVIALADTFLRNLGLKNFSLEINSIGCPNCAKDYDNALIEFYLPQEEKLCSDCRRRLKTNPKRLLDCKVPSCREISQNAPSMLDYLDDSCRNHFEEVQKYLKIMEIPFEVNPRIVRGLDYYTKTAFEFVDNNLGAQNTIIGGGRYDGLVKQLGGRDLPGIGFAGGFERLQLSLEAENISISTPLHPFIFVIAVGEKAKKIGINLLLKIRKNGITGEAAFDKSSLKAQMKAANKSKTDFALILGEEELENNSAALKNMETGEQELIPLKSVLEKILELSSNFS